MKNPGSLTKGMTATATVTPPVRRRSILRVRHSRIHPRGSDHRPDERRDPVAERHWITTATGSGATILSLTSDAVQDELKQAQNDVTAARTVSSPRSAGHDQAERVIELKKLIRIPRSSPRSTALLSASTYSRRPADHRHGRAGRRCGPERHCGQCGRHVYRCLRQSRTASPQP